ncbi:diacylglycerol/lipid kinase family protein [Lentilactobacillus kisonensis]|uniref:Lipid kinase, YegS/Rv2252/BmrU family n=1 Tax=Lentilactobacillus kisonensis F0435 TaxID=797516 RepID=H1LCL2_9LACO|nr:diacylglycerol kinase family protein [Lentilactobacillus kisonensis]EHO53991.1 lipid kinase, YegS/Rv2252/BmrU family [Lentilactobacillus kisonensis F0435]
MEYFIIVNKCAGGNKARLLWPKIETKLNHDKVAFHPYFTKYDGHAVKLTMQILHQLNDTPHSDAIIIAAGGDGTLHETLLGCKRYYADNINQHKVPLAFLPIGSGNDFARALKIPLHWQEALKDILACRSASILNLGHYTNLVNKTDGYFTNNYGIGFDATVVHDANKSPLKNNRYFGKFSYWLAVVKALRTFQGFKVQIRIPGSTEKTFNNAFLVTTTNLPYFGGGIKIAPDASAYENQLDLIIVEKPSIIQLILFVSMIFLKRHLSLRFIHHYVQKQLFITTNDARYGQIDGEELGEHTYQIKLETASYPFWVH